ncbi:MAG: hypothetical protein GY906_08600 [bacterium]|nr:hypothetical protein [bacterium]
MVGAEDLRQGAGGTRKRRFLDGSGAAGRFLRWLVEGEDLPTLQRPEIAKGRAAGFGEIWKREKLPSTQAQPSDSHELGVLAWLLKPEDLPAGDEHAGEQPRRLGVVAWLLARDRLPVPQDVQQAKGERDHE